MSDEPEHSDELPAEWPSDVIGAEEAGVRVFWVSADTMQGLVDRLALVLGEHMADGDELHVTYNAMQSGWQDHAPRKGNLVRSPDAGLDRAALRVQRLRRPARTRRPGRRRQQVSAKAAGTRTVLPAAASSAPDRRCGRDWGGRRHRSGGVELAECSNDQPKLRAAGKTSA